MRKRMLEKIIKRDGILVPYDLEKITIAIGKAMGSFSPGKGRREQSVAAEVEKRLVDTFGTSQGYPGIEQIQDVVEETLMGEGYHKTARRYIHYRLAKNSVRRSVDSILRIESDDERLRDNANVDGNTAMGQMLKSGSAASTDYYLSEVLEPDMADAHRNGLIHIHDLDFYNLTFTCCQIDLAKLFKGGFGTGHGTLREPSGIQTAASLAAIAIQANQNDQHGGQSVPAFDFYLAPYVAKTFAKAYKENFQRFAEVSFLEEDRTKVVEVYENVTARGFTPSLRKNENDIFEEEIEKEMIGRGPELEKQTFVWLYERSAKEAEKATYQAMEGLVHNLNTLHSRAGSQVPFSSLNFGTDTSEEGRMVSRNLLLATEAGLGSGETPIFPILVFKVKDGVSGEPGDPNYDLFELSCKVSAKRLFPNFSFLDAAYNAAYYKEGKPETEASYMGCTVGHETIRLKDERGEIEDDVSFEELWYNYLADDPIEMYGVSEYIEPGKLLAWDSFSGKWAKIKKVIKNPDKDDWFLVTFANEKELTLTADHPLPVEGAKGRTFVKDLEVGDRVRHVGTEDAVAVSGILPLDGYGQQSFDLETDTDRFDLSGVHSHNCRTRVMSNKYDPENEVVTGRGNLSFTSINLPRLAIEAKGDTEVFFGSLEAAMDLVTRQLLHRMKIVGKKKAKNFPFLMREGIWLGSDGLGPDDDVYEVMKQGTLTYGFIGLAEALTALTGKHHGESEEVQELGLKIVGFMRNYADAQAEKDKLNYSLIATPAEGLSYRFTKLDKARYGVIEGVTDKEYYTNSFHVPVKYPISAARKIDIEAPYHALTNAGHISYIELDGQASNNIEAFTAIIQYMKKSGMGYGSVNHPVDRDPVCGYQGIINDVCPCCGRKDSEDGISFERIRRITGYLVGGMDRWNEGKIAEERDRVKHGLSAL
jgi:anaerobic ribonucleoside-triphosphate reductase